MHGIYIGTLFLVVKLFQWFNAFVLTYLLDSGGSVPMMVGIFIFVAALFGMGLVIKRFFPKILSIAWVFIVLALIVTSQIDPSWMIIFLAGLFLYGLIGVEAQILQSIVSHKSLPRFMPLALTVVPLAVSYLFPHTPSIQSQLFYIVSSVFAFFASYSASYLGTYNMGKSANTQRKGTFFVGLLFLAFSILVYYFVFHNATETPPIGLLAFVLLFYACGVGIVYKSVEDFIRRVVGSQSAGA